MAALRADRIPLTELGMGVPAVVERIADDDPELLQYFASHGVAHEPWLNWPRAPFLTRDSCGPDAADAGPYSG